MSSSPRSEIRNRSAFEHNMSKSSRMWNGAVLDCVKTKPYVGSRVMNAALVVVPVGVLLAMWRWPRRFDALLSMMFAVITLGQLAETAMFGGLLESGLVAMFGLACQP